MKKLLLVLLVLCQACGMFEPKDKKDPEDTRPAQVAAVRNLYLNGYRSHLDQYGFVLSEECDSLLFSGLVGATNNVLVNITAARNADGSWERRSIDRPCYPGGSASSISRDMFVGLFWYIWRNQRLDLATQIFQYGRDHDWVMGEGDIFRTYMTPALQATLAEIIYRLGGTDHTIERNYPQAWTDTSDFQAHLLTLSILLRGELTGSIDATMRDLLGKQVGRNPRNALSSYAWHLYTDGDQGQTYDILLDTSLFPSASLPTTANYCTAWLWQRESVNNPDWMPCGNGTEEHSGGDYLFVAGLLLGR